VYPASTDVFAALHLTPIDRVRAVIVGQDPYYREGQAHGLSFSVRPPCTPPPSLRNILRELQTDGASQEPANGSLVQWARNGVLLLNTILTVDAGKPGSHRNAGWQELTDQIIRVVAARPRPVVFLLWGRYAQRKRPLVDEAHHIVLCAAHPSPFSAKRFLGSRPFSTANTGLKQLGQPPIEWSLAP
jgi:uracil-DNA glycosylase